MIPSSREGIAAFDQALLNACALLRPPEKLNCAEWTDKYGMLSPEGAALPGKFFISNAEYQREPLEILSDPAYQTVVLMWSSQVGKTQIGLFANGYFAEHDPCPILNIQPSEDMAKVVSKDRIQPMIRDTPILRPLFGKGGDTFHMPFPGGQLTMGWASSPAQLASRPIRFLWTDEEGRYGPNIEGDAVDQGRKRLATFKGNRKHLRTSSPALRRTCRITKAYEQSDQREYFVPCPQCGHCQTLRFEQLKWPAGKPNECYYVCEANGCAIFEQDKFSMIRHAKARGGGWRAQNPGGGDGKTAGFHLNALYSTIGYEWAEIVAEFLKCEGIPDKLQVFTNTVLALPWDEQAEGADLNAVQKHAEDYPAQAPAWSIMFTCGTDVQKDRIEATKWGWGEHNQSGVIEHRKFYGDTSDHRSGAWLEYDEWRRQRVQHETGLMLPIACTFIDSGDGNRTQTVYEYCRAHEREKVFACKGSSQTGAVLVSEAKRVGRTRTLLVMVGTSTAKDTIYGRLQIEDKSRPGYIHFPKHHDSGCGAEFFSHLTAEALVTTTTKAGERSQWVKQRPRNEALDCAVYAYAAKVFTRANLAELARKLAARAALVKPEETAAALRQWAERVGETAMALYSSLSSASSAESPSPAAPNSSELRRKKKKKRLFRPGASWIRGN